MDRPPPAPLLGSFGMNAARLWWHDVPTLAKQVLAAGSGFAAALLVVGSVLSIPQRVDAVERENARQDSELSELRTVTAEQARKEARTAERLDYIICLLEYQQGEGRRTPVQCSADLFRSGAP